MNTKLLISLILLLCLSSKGFGSSLDSLRHDVTLGITGGISQHSSFSGDIYVGNILPVDNMDVNVGYSFFRNKTQYAGVDDLQFSSHGLFVEGNYYVIAGLYGGARFALNLNWIDQHSQKKFDMDSELDSPTFFTAIAGYLQMGYCKPISKKIGIKLQGQIGLHNYKISQGYLLINTSSSSTRDAELYGIETHTDFIYNIGLGVIFRL